MTEMEMGEEKSMEEEEVEEDVERIESEEGRRKKK